jgi:uncharacterized LabA/DUF88 family protein
VASRNCRETLTLFIDFHNLEASLRNEGRQVDILELRNYLSEGRSLLESFVYIGRNPNNSQEDDKFHRMLRINGFLVKTKKAKVLPDGSLKCDLDLELALDVVQYVSGVKPDIVVLVTGDGDFAPLANWLRLRGIRVEVASTPNSLSQDLREASNGYIDLDEAIEQIQGAGEKEPASIGEEVKKDGNGNYQRQEGGDPTDIDG